MTQKQARIYLALLGSLTVTIALFIGGAIEQSGEIKLPSNRFNASSTNLLIPSNPTASTVVFPVLRVVDGDTIDVNINGTKERVRLIGINTPETVDPKRSVQCYGPEASKHMHELLAGKSVSLEQDPLAGDRDKYGRLLRHVFFDGQDINAEEIKDGYAFEYTYQHKPYTHQAEYKKLQDEAKQNQRGLWSPTTCNGMLK